MSKESRPLSRRAFIQRSAQVAGGSIALSGLIGCAGNSQSSPKLVPGRILGANDRINVAVIGVRGRGGGLMQDFAKQDNVVVKTLCDIDLNVLADKAKALAESQGSAPQQQQDIRQVLDDKDIDAIVVATPDHWHALGTIWGCQAGKHVYVEKPCCYSVWEGRKMVEAARKYNRLVQVGFQNRSIKGVRQAMAFLHGGGIGEVYMARGLCYKTRTTIGRVSDGWGKKEYYIWGKKGPTFDDAYMKKVNYDLWLGPARTRPFNYHHFHYNWHWLWEYGSGDIGNQGPHQLDVARWGLGQSGHPVKVTSAGGFYAQDSDQETPNTQTAIFTYADGREIVFDVRGLPSNGEGAMYEKIKESIDTKAGHYKQVHKGTKIGNLFYGSEGWVYVNGGYWQSYFGYGSKPGPGSGNVKDGEYADPMNLAGAGGGGHVGNFIQALRANDQKRLTADIEEGFISSTLPQLANISYRTGRTLTFDGQKEKFVSDKEANKLLRRKVYRKPYDIPDKV